MMNEEQTQGSVQAQTAAQPADTTVAQPATAVEPKPVEDLPAETRERTREQFEKLLESNRRLYEANELLRHEMEQRRTTNQVFDPIQSVPPQQQRPVNQEVNPSDFVERDPITGESYINEQRLRARLEEIQQRADRAEQAIQSYVKSAEEREIERQNKEAFAQYPELEPGAKNFDGSFHKQVRGILADSMFNPDEYGGRPLSFKEAADFVRAQNPKQTQQVDEKAQVDAQAKTKAARELKEQVSNQAVSQPRAQRELSDDEELDNLRYRTRYQNDDEALALRIMHTEHILPKDEA